MHGLIFAELKKFVDHKQGATAWTTLLATAGMSGRIFVSAQHYGDEDAVRLITTASSLTGVPVPALLEEFGAFIVPDLMQLYGALLDPTWKTLDVIERTEHTIHRVVRLRNPGASPPELVCTRVGERKVSIQYTSPRRMCSIAKGISRGLAAHFGETIDIDEESCMHAGATRCLLAVRLVD